MNLADYRRENVAVYSSTASTVARQLGFAGIAIVWTFSARAGEPSRVPGELVPATLWIVASLALDLFHYIVAAVVWAVYLRRWEREASDPSVDFVVSPAINYPGNTLFALKLVAIVVAYVSLGDYLVSRLL